MRDAGLARHGAQQDRARSPAARQLDARVDERLPQFAVVVAAGPVGVRFLSTDIAALDEGGFASAYTMHVQMNVPDKRAFYAEIARRLRPEGRLAVFEVCRAGTVEVAPPLPWTIDGSDSHLVSADELRTAIEAAGFTTVDWIDETAWTLEWFDRFAARLASSAPRATLAAVLHDGPVRMMTFLTAIRSGAVSIQRGAFVLSPSRA